MRLDEIAQRLSLENLTPHVAPPAADVVAGYASDLLSDVLAHGPRGGVLVTVQVHLNVIAVALHAELAAVVFAADRRPDEAVVAKAIEEGLALFVSRDSAFDVVGRLYALGVRGNRA
jgi:hypothetical protein